MLRNLKAFIEGADEGPREGLVVFTLGSVIPVSSMPVYLARLFQHRQRINVHNSVPEYQSILNNVLMVDWLPQQDLLGNKKKYINSFYEIGHL